MTTLTKTLKVYPFAYNKILGGQRKIDIRPYTPSLHELRVGDNVEYVNIETQTSLTREVRGIALFEDFDTAIDMLSPEMIGYNSREEIKARIERMYVREDIQKYGVCALFIAEPSIKHMMKMTHLERIA